MSHITLDPNGCIFNSVGAFIEQVGRRSTWKWAELDMMNCIWNGPVSGALNFMPKKGSPHPTYPMMFVTDSEIINQAALVADVQVTYQGIINSSVDITASDLGGGTNYITKPTITTTPVQGSRDFQQFWSVTHVTSSTQSVPIVGTSGGTTLQTKSVYTYDYGTRTETVRYAGQNVSIRYYSFPGSNVIQYSNISGKYVGWRILSQVSGPWTTIAAGVPDVPGIASLIGQIPPIYSALLGFQTKQVGLWWEITEIYGPTF